MSFLVVDCGTSNSVAFVVDDTGQKFLLSGNGEDVYVDPSIAGYDDNRNLLFGRDALSLPEDRLSRSFKRLLNLDAFDKQALMDVDHPLPEDSFTACIKYFKNKAEKLLSISLAKIILTVPVNFGEIARKKIRQSATAAGLLHCRLLNEPSAASFGAFGSGDGIFAIYDLGGGTLDIAIGKTFNSVMKILSVGGSPTIGGDDADIALRNILFKDIPKQNLFTEKKALLKLKQAKELLSVNNSIVLDEVFSGCGKIEITRDILYEAVTPTARKASELFVSTVEESGFKLKDLDAVIMTGGGSRLESAYLELRNATGLEPHRDINPELTVASGAAAYASSITKGEAICLLDVAPADLGIETADGGFSVIIPRNSPIPIRETEYFTTGRDGQTKISIIICQKFCGETHKGIIRLLLKDIEPTIAGLPRILVSLHLDAFGLLSIDAIEEHSGKKVSASTELFSESSFNVTNVLAEARK